MTLRAARAGSAEPLVRRLCQRQCRTLTGGPALRYATLHVRSETDIHPPVSSTPFASLYTTYSLYRQTHLSRQPLFGALFTDRHCYLERRLRLARASAAQNRAERIIPEVAGTHPGRWPWCPGKCHILPYHPGALAGAAAVCGGRFLDLFLPRPWSPLGRQNEHFAWLWRLAQGSGP